MWQWQQAGIIEEQRRTQIARAWRRHRAEYTSEEWEAHMRDRQAQGEAERERESTAQRKARKKAQAQAHGEGRRLTPSTGEGVRRKGRTRSGEYGGGWTIVGTLIRYKKGQLREQRMRENNASDTDKEGSGEDAHRRGTDEAGREQMVVTEEGVRSDVSIRIQQDTGGQSTEAESGNVGEMGNEDTGREESEEVRKAQAESTRRTREEEGIMTQEEMEGVERGRTEVEVVVSSEQWAEEVAREMGYEAGGEEGSERTAQATVGPSTHEHESRTTESQVSEEESVRTDQHGATQQTDLTHDEDTVAGGDAPQQMEQREEVGEHEAHTPQPLQTPTIVSDAIQHLGSGKSSAHVKPGCEGRVLRGAGKQGGYDETPRRERPRRKAGPRIRYVDEDERGGGTTEQGIRVGPVCVWRITHGHRSEAEGAGTPPKDPG